MHVRPAVMADIEAALAVGDALSAVLYGRSEAAIEHLRAAWGHGDAWVATDPAGGVIGYATLEAVAWPMVWRTPITRGRPGVGAAVDANAARVILGETIGSVPAAAADLVALYRSRGWAHTRQVLRMEIDVEAEPRPPAWPAGVAVRTYAQNDGDAVHALMQEAFAGSAEEVPPFSRWHPWMTEDPGFDAGVWFLAEAGAELAGACLCWSEGWVKDLAVRPAWRGRGLGEALLRQAFGEFHRRGLTTVGLKVDSDNPTGAVRLYERVGMALDRTYVMFSSH